MDDKGRKLLEGYLAILRHKQIRPPMNPGVQEVLEAEVRSYLAAFPADDGEPVTEDWLRSVGVHKDAPAKNNTRTVVITKIGPTLWLNIGDGYYCNAVLLAGNTRGVVRRLLAALGVVPANVK